MEESLKQNFGDDLENLDLNKLLVWRFGKGKHQSDGLFKLVLKGKKKATSYLFKDESILDVPKFSILTNWDETQKVIVETTNVEVVPFKLITKSHAKNEGEGFGTLLGWKFCHKIFFGRELSKSKEKLTKGTLVVCETFSLVKILQM